MVELGDFLAEYSHARRSPPMLAVLLPHSKIGANLREGSPRASPLLSAPSAFSGVDFPQSSSAFFSPRLCASASNTPPVWFRLRRVRERWPQFQRSLTVAARIGRMHPPLACRSLFEHANLGGHVLQDIVQKWGAILQQVVLRHVVVRQIRPDAGVLNQVGIRVIAVEVFPLAGL